MIRTVQTFAGDIKTGDLLLHGIQQQCEVTDISDLGGSKLKLTVECLGSVYIWNKLKHEVVHLVIPEKIVRNPEDDPSHHARRFREGESRDYKNNAEMNNLFVKCQENYMNDLLKTRGHVFLNEAYDALGFERSAAGALVGWHRSVPGEIKFKLLNDQARTKKAGDLFIDFNIHGVVFDKLPGEWELYG